MLTYRAAQSTNTYVCLLAHTPAECTCFFDGILDYASSLSNCLQEWQRLESVGLANTAGLAGSTQVACLQDWVQAANADFLLVEALLGTPLDPHHSLATALPGIFVLDTSGKPFLSR